MSESTINLLIGLGGLLMGMLVFFVGQKAASHNSGREWGTMKSNIDHIMTDVKEIKLDIRANSQATLDMLRKEEAARIEGDKRLHERIDEHIERYHFTKEKGV